MENPTKMDDNWGYHHDLGTHHLVISGPGRGCRPPPHDGRSKKTNLASLASAVRTCLALIQVTQRWSDVDIERHVLHMRITIYLSIYLSICTYTVCIHFVFTLYRYIIYIRNMRIVCVYCKHYTNMDQHIYTYACTYLYIYMHISIHKSVHNVHTWSYLYLLKYKYNCIYICIQKVNIHK